MACLKRPLLNVAKRSYCAAAPKTEPLATKVSLVYNVGSRNETASNIGVTHAVRTALAWGSPGNSMDQDKFTYFTDNDAFNVSCTTNREQLIYSVDGFIASQEDMDRAMAYLKAVTRNNQFTANNTKRAQFVASVKRDLSVLALSPNVQFAEAAHKAAFGMGGLANSLYMPSYAVGTHSYDTINNFMTEFCTPANCTVVVDTTAVMAEAAGKKTQAAPSPYTTGEVRVDAGIEMPIAGLFFEGASWGSKDRVALSVLAQALGCGAKSRVAAASSVPCETGVLNYNYADTGLFGVCFSANNTDMGKVAESTVAALSDIKAGKLTQADVDAAKIQAAVASAHANPYDVATTTLKPAEEAMNTEIDAINSISLQQVQSVAKKVLGSAPSMASIGDLRTVPFLKNIKF